ncbi:MAG: 1-deoxy-D-xylulose-5-phosphate reductoisomerase [Proteobacteria bacterium]|nr:1-deoxy-D-xylulose-5-phosphate reductoisomerase [Pseudomonadota bacterium]
MTATRVKLKPSFNPKRVSILGSTGSIGQSTIKLLQQSPERYEVVALSARSNVALLAEQARALKPAFVAIEDATLLPELKTALAGTNIKIGAGCDAIIEAAAEPADWVMSAIVGAAALAPTLAAIKQGTIIALANKECLVCAGEMVMAEVNKHGTTLLPVDSEHNALFQAMDFSKAEMIDRLTLTASGGPFRTLPAAELKNVTVKQAVHHPNWSMGAKISVDSATMMNKGLEIIEAYHLFPVEKEQIDVLVHPQSIVHGLVSYCDGSVVAGLSFTDMRVPIAFTLGWPARLESSGTPKLDLAKIGNLTFEAPNEDKFPALRIAREALIAGGSAPLVLNAANEVAVQAFINEKIGFMDITRITEQAIETCRDSKTPASLEEVIALDSEARNCTASLIASL